MDCVAAESHTRLSLFHLTWVFPGGSAGKESASTVRDLGWIPGLGALGEGKATYSSILA